jgi:hypothetical protein
MFDIRANATVSPIATRIKDNDYDELLQEIQMLRTKPLGTKSQAVLQ